MNHAFPHLRHRGARQGRAQADAHRHHGRADRRRRQGLALLHQERRPGQRADASSARSTPPTALRTIPCRPWRSGSRMMTPEQAARLQYRSRRGHRHRGDRRFPGHLPVHVHGGAGADARDRHSEVDGRVEAGHCGRGAARDRGDGRGRRAGGHCRHLWRARCCLSTCFPPSTSRSPRIGSPGRGHRLCRSAVRRALSGLDGGAQRTPSTRWPTNSRCGENSCWHFTGSWFKLFGNCTILRSADIKRGRIAHRQA